MGLIRPPLTVRQILTWADDHHARTGRWPTSTAGPVEGASGENWVYVDAHLRGGGRGLPGGSSLARLLAAERGARNRRALPRLSIPLILEWADRHQAITGAWPGSKAGTVAGQPGEDWGRIDTCLRKGKRGLPGGTSLGRLLYIHRGKRYGGKPALSPETILAWAERHRLRTGQWPTLRSGPIEGAPGESWVAVNSALVVGARGLPGGDTLFRLLQRERGYGDPRPGRRRRSDPDAAGPVKKRLQREKVRTNGTPTGVL
jgi:hypothetical protein